MKQMKDSGIEWIGQIPEDWGLNKIGALYEERNIKVSDQDYPPLSVTKQGVVPQLETAAKTDNGDNRKLIKKNDFVINSRSDRRGSCGISEYDGSCSLINTVLKPRHNMHNRYYNYVFRSELFADEFYRWGNGIVDDLWSTKWSNMKRIYVPFPNIEIQRRIADFLDEKCGKIDRYIEKQQQVIEKLKAYKQSVITEAVTKGINPNVPMKDSGIEWIGMIPGHWSSRRLRYLGTCVNGISKGGEYFGSGYPFVSYGDVYKNMELPSSVAGLVETTEDEREWYSVKEGDVFFTRTSETIEEVALTSTCMKTIENATFAGFLIRFRPNTNLLTKEFSKYYFRSDKHRLFFVKEMNLVTRASLSQELLKRLPVLLPPIDEQLTIAAHLEQKCSNIDEAINKKYAVIEKLIKYKKSLIYEAVTGKLEV